MEKLQWGRERASCVWNADLKLLKYLQSVFFWSTDNFKDEYKAKEEAYSQLFKNTTTTNITNAKCVMINLKFDLIILIKRPRTLYKFGM